MTSRNSNLKRIASTNASWEVQALAESDALMLLSTSADLDLGIDFEPTLQQIAKELCYFPLPLDQAGALILSGICTVHDFLQLYRSHRNELMRNKDFKGASQYGQAVYTTGDLSYAEVTRRATAENKKEAHMALLLLTIFPSLHHTNVDSRRCFAEQPLLVINLRRAYPNYCVLMVARRGIALHFDRASKSSNLSP